MRRPHTSPAAAIAASLRAVGQPRSAILRNGVRARIRPLRLDDARRFGDFVGKLSEASRDDRFHGDVGDCTPFTLQQLVCVDGVRHVVFVAALALADGEELIGEVRYRVGDEPGCAEVAIAVVDAWQGQGLADQLIDCLLEAAHDAGLRRLYGEVLAANTRMIGFLHRMGFQTCSQGSSGDLLRLERGVSPRRPQGARGLPGALRRWLIGQFALGVQSPLKTP